MTNIEVHLISLRARLKKATQYILNSDLQLEAELLRAQIKALEEAQAHEEIERGA